MKTLAIVSLLVAAACALIIAFDLIKRPRKMKIMNVVWPLSALYGSVLALLGYFTIGGSSKEKPPMWEAGIKGSLHCGSGCALGDIVGEFGVFFLGIRIAGEIIWAYIIFDFIFAFLFGIVFQYFSIVPMRHLSFGKGIVAALKADTLSISAFQVGMYAWMLLVRFAILGRDIPATEPEHWLSMQLAMVIGVATTFPMNLWLIRKGWKERM